MRPVEGDLVVDLVGEDQQIVPAGQFHQVGQGRGIGDRAGRVARRVEQDGLGALGDQRLHVGGLRDQIGLGPQREVDGDDLQQLHHLGVVRPARISEQHLGARIHQRDHAAVDPGDSARRDHDLIGGGVDAVALPDLGRQSFSQRGDAGVGRVLGEAVEGSLSRGLADVAGRGEVGLPRLEVDGAIDGAGQLHHLAYARARHRRDGLRRLHVRRPGGPRGNGTPPNGPR